MLSYSALDPGLCLAFSAELSAPCRDRCFGYNVFCRDTFVGASFFLVETDDLLFKFRSVIL